MKEKIKRFLIEKKELLIFIGVLAVVFTTIISIANIAMKSVNDTVKSSNEEPVVVPSESENPVIIEPSASSVTPVVEPSESGNPVVTPSEPVTPVTISLPVDGDYIVVRTFFDTELSEEELVSAVINTGTYLLESRGISYARSDNTSFDVFSIYPGTIESITTDALMGSVVTISHEDNMKSVYSSLSSVAVSVGDEVDGGTKIGLAGSSILDNESGVHVHLEIIVDEVYINPTAAFGKEVDEVSSSKWVDNFHSFFFSYIKYP